MYHLKLFGGASVEGSDAPLTGRATQRHRLALLALLATTPKGGLTRDRLVGYLWPERSDERSRHALSDSVYRINKALGSDVVVAMGDELRLDRDRLPSDVAAFREALDREDWETAVEIYQGPYLDGFHLRDALEFERWVDGERRRFAQQYASALEARAEELSDGGDASGSAAVWQRRAALDPYDSRVAARLMEALEAAGNRPGALRHAGVHARLLKEEFGTAPDPAVERLAQRLRTASPDVDPERQASTSREEEPVPLAGVEEGEGGDRQEERGAAGERDGREGRAAVPSTDGRRPTERSRSGKRWMSRAAAALLLFLVLAAGARSLLDWRTGASEAAAPSVGIAVLPFQNLTADEENRYFADGVTEDILTNLARIQDLRVIALGSVTSYRDTDRDLPGIADELGVRYILEGSVRRVDDRVRIAVRLVDATSSAQVWADSYDRLLGDIFAVQSEIARRIAGLLEAELVPSVAARFDRAPTEDLVAYNLYLHGRYLWHQRTEESLQQSAHFFEEAVERDASFARAWAGLADALAVLAFYDYLPPRTAYPRAREAAERALALDADLAEAHASLGYITLYHGWDWEEAEVAFRRSLALNPSYSVGHQWYANLLVAMGRFEEAVRAMSRAREVNPLSLIANGALGWVYYYAGRYEEAVRQADLALDMDPDWDLGHLWRGLALEELGRLEEAVASLRRAVELSGGSGISVAALAHAQATAGAEAEARRLLEELLAAGEEGDYLPAFDIAKAHLALDEPEEALRWLERALEERSHSMVFLRVDPQLAPLRDDPRFGRLLEKVGLEARQGSFSSP